MVWAFLERLVRGRPSQEVPAPQGLPSSPSPQSTARPPPVPFYRPKVEWTVDLRKFARAGTGDELERPAPPAVEALVSQVRQVAQLILSGTPSSFPWFAVQVLNAVDRPDMDATRLAEIISRDALIAAQVLRTANSAHYSRGISTTDLREAIARLGLVEVADITAIASAQALVRPASRDSSDYLALSADLWTHSIVTSMAAGWLARHLGGAHAPVVFMGGLLHDVGKILSLQAVERGIRERRIPRLSLSHTRQLIDLTHVDVGVQMAAACRFPDSILAICRDHHQPTVGQPFERELHVCVLADVLDDLIAGANVSTPDLANAVGGARALRMDQAYVDAFAREVAGARAKAAAVLGPMIQAGSERDAHPPDRATGGVVTAPRTSPTAVLPNAIRQSCVLSPA